MIFNFFKKKDSKIEKIMGENLSKTIEDFCFENKIDKVDFIHCDAQGLELRIFKGLGKIRPELIFSETCEYNSYKGSGTRDELDNYMLSIGYEILARYEYDTLYKLKS